MGRCINVMCCYCRNLLLQELAFSCPSSPLMIPKNSYLTHLSMEGNGSESKISEQQSCPLSIVTGGAEYHKGVSSQFIQNINQVGILSHKAKIIYVTEPGRRLASWAYKLRKRLSPQLLLSYPDPQPPALHSLTGIIIIISVNHEFHTQPEAEHKEICTQQARKVLTSKHKTRVLCP